MELYDVIEKIEHSNEFKTWKKSHATAFLAHAFVMLDEPNKNMWQIGYFDKAKNTMSTFILNVEEIKTVPDQEIIKAEQKILELKPSEVKIPLAEALETAQKTKNQHYPREQTLKTFFIIQNLEAHGTVFNITYFTASFKTINIKISTTNGKVVHNSIQALATFG